MTNPFEDQANRVEDRVADLLSRLTLHDKAGLLFHDITAVGPGGDLMTKDNAFGRPATTESVCELRINHFNLAGQVDDVAELVSWHNNLQRMARDTGPGIPVTISTDPRHAFSQNPGTEAIAGAFSQWPQSLGFAAIRDPALVQRYADIARQEYLAAGIRVALHPQIDLATEPRWSRIGMTFGEDAELTSELVAAYIRGFQGTELGSDSVATMTKHFPGGGPQKDGEDPHFVYGKEQVYPGGEQSYHLKPFKAAIRAGTSQMMPYYGIPIGTEWEEVGFAFNESVITRLLREELRFDGIVCTDWGLIGDRVVFGQDLPARAWGVEHLSELERVIRILNVGCDQFGGESRPDLVIEAVRSGAISEERIDTSVRRILAEKFVLGLFDSPYLDPEHAAATIGRDDFVAEGRAAQQAAIARLTEPSAGAASLPLKLGGRVYTENLGDASAARLGQPVACPSEADFAVLRLSAPHEPRPGGFEAFFHTGSLEFSPSERERLLGICEQVPTIVVLFLDRPAVVPELALAAAAFLVDFGAQDDAVIDVLVGEATAKGRLPFDLPSSADAVERSRSDVAFDTDEPLFRFGDGLLD